MIAISDVLYSDILRALPETAQARSVATRLRAAALDSARRELDFDDAPTFCRPQAGM
jgi:hypothetical protein